jgi:hypothetical protein
MSPLHLEIYGDYSGFEVLHSRPNHNFIIFNTENKYKIQVSVLSWLFDNAVSIDAI